MDDLFSGKSIRVTRNDYPSEAVKSRLLKIDSEISSLSDCLKKTQNPQHPATSAGNSERAPTIGYYSALAVTICGTGMTELPRTILQL